MNEKCKLTRCQWHESCQYETPCEYYEPSGNGSSERYLEEMIETERRDFYRQWKVYIQWHDDDADRPRFFI